MALFTVDPNNVFGNYLDEAGSYNVKVLPSSSLGQSNNGNPMVTLELEVTDGVKRGAMAPRYRLTWDDSSQEKEDLSVKRFNTILVNSKVPAGTQVDNLQVFVNGMIGREFSITTAWEKYNGKYYLNVENTGELLAGGSQPNGQTRPDEGNTSDSNPINSNSNDGLSGNPWANQKNVHGGQPGNQHVDNMPF